MKKKTTLLLLFFSFLTIRCISQNKTDSLISFIKIAKDDTIKEKALLKLSTMLGRKSPLIAMDYANQALKLGYKLNSKTFIASSYNTIGTIFRYKGDYDKALDNNFISLRIYKEIKDISGVANVLNNIGNVYYHKGDYSKSLENYLAALKTREETGDKDGIASSYSNVGMVYGEKGEYDNSLNYFLKSLTIREEIGDKEGIGISLNNIGEVYLRQGNYKKAVEFHLRALSIRKEINDKKGTAESLVILGDDYLKLGDNALALNYFSDALKLFQETDNKIGIANSLINLGQLYYKQNDFEKSLNYLTKGLSIAKEIQAKPEISDCYKTLSEIYAKNHKFQDAYEYHLKFSDIKDSLLNTESSKQLAEMQTKYETENKEQKINLLQKNNIIKDIEIDRSKTQKLYYLSIIALALLIISLSIFAFIKIRKQNSVLTENKKFIELRNSQLELQKKEIVDSINYAKRIQDAMLKEEEYISTHLPPHFILFKPKDIVSGDFYWALEKENFLYLAAADCTGHGVPGAFLTLLGTSFLNEINAVDKLFTPAEIINQLRDKIVKELGNQGKTRDGMDISLIRINLKTFDSVWAGAYNPLWMIKNNGEFVEITADKQPVGYNEVTTGFTDHSFKLSKGDMVYLFTDGYADQFGGKHGKKFKYRQLNDQLFQIKDLPTDEQKEKLNETFIQWQGNLEQVDDVLLIGIRV